MLTAFRRIRLTGVLSGSMPDVGTTGEHYAEHPSGPSPTAVRRPFVARRLPLVAHLDRPST
ncbi:hypothetical protein DLJ96_01735 [Actinotalea fermentans ATCC 43279 = JCM 9966 = DSM 3133]|nr:hypothetical protein DLJ96_01735 [Actinotalea fermentans ATCC 43279 = JCM 9966 = DSM 3133]